MSPVLVVLAVLVSLLLAPAAHAHVGSPNVFFEGMAGPWPVRVVIRPPGVIPGLAEITIRVKQGAPERIQVQPVQWKAGVKGAPPSDEAKSVPGEKGLWSAQLWMMTASSYSVRVRITGPAGEGLAIVPVVTVRTGRLAMQRYLGFVLGGLGLFLVAGALTIVGAAVRESVLAPGEEPDVRRRHRARLTVAATGVLLVLLLLGGKSWWDGVDADYRERIFRPFHVRTAVVPEGSAEVLRLEIDDPRWVRERDWSALMPDHGKLMHLFLVREPSLDAFAHLHPVPRDPSRNRFEAPLPPLPTGRYRLYADIVHENGFAQTLTDSVEITSPPPPAGRSAGPPPDPDDSWRTAPPTLAAAQSAVESLLEGGLAMTWERGSAPLVAAREVELRFTVRDAAGRPAPLEPYMGMLSHAVISRDDGRVFVHLHPVGSFSMAAQQAFAAKDPAAPMPGTMAGMGHAAMPGTASTAAGISFPYEFPQPGRYRLWVQVKSGGAVRTGVFDAEVK